MSTLKVDTIQNAAGTGAPNFSLGLKVAGALVGGSATAKSAAYTITDTDAIETILLTTGASNLTVDLPTAADNVGRVITLIKVDNGAGSGSLDGEGAETIDGVSTFVVRTQYDSVSVISNGTGWNKIGKNYVTKSQVRLSGASAANNGHGSGSTAIRRFLTTIENVGSGIVFADSATLGSTFTIGEAGIYSMQYMDLHTTTVKAYGFSLNSAQLTTSIASITNSARLMHTQNGATSLRVAVSYTGYFAVGDVIRAHTEGAAADWGATDDNVQFQICQVSRLQ